MSDKVSVWIGRVGWVLGGLLAVFVVVMLSTDVWPYMHEVFWQHSWKPVCTAPDGRVVFC